MTLLCANLTFANFFGLREFRPEYRFDDPSMR
ncbi:hypothetical protein CPL00229_CDS0147 [Escherichia phage vB_Eco_mar004NP2]